MTRPRLPAFVLNPERSRTGRHELKARLRAAGLATVCESARCPNIGECFKRPTAAFMVLGNRCNRGCRFCAVKPGAPASPDPNEPQAVADTAAALDLKYIVVTSVTRDDLPDGGAEHFARTIAAIRQTIPAAKVEVLVPDFQGSESALATVLAARPDVLNHNLETVPRLYPRVRPGADYKRSLELLARAAKAGTARVKSGLMVGLGEERDEVLAVFDGLAAAGCGIVTVGQYLQPRRTSLAVERYWEPDEFAGLTRAGKDRGLVVFAGPLVRSSYLADRVFENLP